MQKINSPTNLADDILEMQKKQVEEWSAVKQQLQMIHESLQPINLLKSTIEKATAPSNLGRNFLITSAALTTGYFSKKILSGLSDSPIKKLLGIVLVFGATQIMQRFRHRIQSNIQP